MKVLIATDKFKDALDAPAAAAAMAEGAQAALATAKIIQLPLSDGGEGFATLSGTYTGAKIISVAVTGPLQQTVTARYAWLSRHKRACIEMAEAAGLHLIPPTLRSPLHTTSYGVGELILHAVHMGAKEIILGIGGSATHDVGAGMAAALGYRFLDSTGRPFLPTGGSLQQVSSIKKEGAEKLLQDVKMQVACDVVNPLIGPTGAAYSYALQKGALGTQLPLLEAGAAHLADIISRDLQKQVSRTAGGGAAGGMGAGALAFLSATLTPGAAMLLELADFAQKAAAADLIITGEGKTDTNSLQGKLVGEVAQQAALLRKPLLLLCGKLELSVYQQYKAPFWQAIPLAPPGEALEQSLKLCRRRLIAASKEGLRLYLQQTKTPHR